MKKKLQPLVKLNSPMTLRARLKGGCLRSTLRDMSDAMGCPNPHRDDSRGSKSKRTPHCPSEVEEGNSVGTLEELNGEKKGHIQHEQAASQHKPMLSNQRLMYIGIPPIIPAFSACFSRFLQNRGSNVQQSVGGLVGQ